MRRVVITGLGTVSPLGLSVKETWEAILQGKSGIRPITAFDIDDLGVRISGSVQNFDPIQYMPPKRCAEIRYFHSICFCCGKRGH